MTTVWLPGPLLAAPTPSVMAASIDDSAGPVRAALDALYDKTTFASQAEALSGTINDKAMSPLRTRQAFDGWIVDSIDARVRRFARVFDVNVNNSRTGQATIAFPAGMFVSAPVCQVTLASAGSVLWHTWYNASVTSDSGTTFGATFQSNEMITTTLKLALFAMGPRY